MGKFLLQCSEIKMIMTILALSSALSLCTVLALIINISHKLWWVPNRVQHVMESQGISGPPYRFIHGSTKEIVSMRNQVMSKPMGLCHDVVPRLQPHIHYWTKSYGRSYIQWHGPQAQMVITEPEFIKEILNNRDKLFQKLKPNPFMKKILGDGVGMSEGEKWAKMRKLANHAFQAESLKGMVPVMVESVEAMVERWKGCEGEEIDVFEDFVLLTSEIITRTAFGSTYLEGKVVFDTLKSLIVLASRNVLKQRFPGASIIFKSADQTESEKMEKRMHDCLKEIIKRREKKVMNSEEKDYGDDFLGVLLEAHHNADEKQRISVDEIVDECKTFYFVGQETTNSLLTWTMFLLAAHEDWQERARKEVFGKQNPKPEGIFKLKTLGMIINESLRLYPPVISVPRKAKKELRLGDLNLPPNISLIVPILSIHHGPRIWGNDADLFKPERFSEGVAKATNNSIGTFLPFGMGPRICVGFNFATIEVKIALAMILQRYTFTLSPAYVHSPTQLFAIFPKHGLQLILNPC